MASALFLTRERTLRSVKILMRKYIPSLSKAILSRNNHFSIASDLYNENVIPEMIYSSMHTMDEPELIKVISLLTAIRRAVERDPDKFPVVLAAMKKHTPVDEIVEKMEKEYYTRERVIVKFLLLICGVVVTVVSGIMTYYFALELESSCTEVTRLAIDEQVYLNLSSLSEAELNHGYFKCSHLTTAPPSFEELVNGCKGEGGVSSECFMRRWLDKWLWGSDGEGEDAESEGDGEDDSPCWEEVVTVLQCLGQDSLATHIKEHLVGVGS